MRTKEAKTLQELIENTPRHTRLLFVADVGGTNTRVSFVPVDLASTHSILFFKAQAHSVPEVLKLFAETGAKAGKEITGRIVAAAIAIPGPVTENGNKTTIANFKAENTEGRTLTTDMLPKSVCPKGRSRLLNDLHACAAGIAALNHIGAFSDAFAKMWGPRGKEFTDEEVNIGGGSAIVLAPGTGLGTAVLHFNADTNRYIVIPLEFGHVNVATYKHTCLMNSWVQHLKRGNHPPEFDDICSGRGLEYIYSASQDMALHGVNCAEKKPSASGNSKKISVAAPQISKLAEAGDFDALNAFSVKYGILMNLASQLSMGFIPKTVVIAGDNAVRHSFFLGNPQVAKQLRDEFVSHTMERMGFMSRVQMVRQSQEMNLNLIGAAFEASQLGDNSSKVTSSGGVVKRSKL